MRNITNYINEQRSINVKTRTKKGLQRLIKKRILEEGPKCNLNDIDVSAITDMSYVFFYNNFHGDISNWDVSNVTNMTNMFIGCSALKTIRMVGCSQTTIDKIKAQLSTDGITDCTIVTE